MLASIPTELTLIYAMLYDTALTRQPSYILCDTTRILRFLLTVLLLLLLPAAYTAAAATAVAAMRYDAGLVCVRHRADGQHWVWSHTGALAARGTVSWD